MVFAIYYSFLFFFIYYNQLFLLLARFIFKVCYCYYKLLFESIHCLLPTSTCRITQKNKPIMFFFCSTLLWKITPYIVVLCGLYFTIYLSLHNTILPVRFSSSLLNTIYYHDPQSSWNFSKTVLLYVKKISFNIAQKHQSSPKIQ